MPCTKEYNSHRKILLFTGLGRGGQIEVGARHNMLDMAKFNTKLSFLNFHRKIRIFNGIIYGVNGKLTYFP